MTRRLARLAALAALVGMLAVPAAALAADPSPSAPPANARAWQAHLDLMRAMGPNVGSHISDCVTMHGSMAGLLGANGMMVEGMAGMMAGEARP